MNLSVANKIVCLGDLPLEVEDAPGSLAVDDEVGVEHHQALHSLPALEAVGVNIFRSIFGCLKYKQERFGSLML